MITRTGMHAIRALVALARLPEGTFAGAAAVAEQVDAPPNYLGKLLKTLAQTGLLESQKGLHGGFRLARAAKNISLYDVLEPIEDVGKWEGCILGHTECSEIESCSIHEEWKKVRGGYLRMLRRTTIADLLARDRLFNVEV